MHACSVVSNSLQPYGLWCTRLLCPWDFSGKFFTTEPPGTKKKMQTNTKVDGGWWSQEDSSRTMLCKISLCLITQSCQILCNPKDCSLSGSTIHGDSPGKNTGVGCHALFQGIFSTQGWNPGLPHCGHILYRLSHQGNPIFLYIR